MQGVDVALERRPASERDDLETARERRDRRGGSGRVELDEQLTADLAQPPGGGEPQAVGVVLVDLRQGGSEPTGVGGAR